MCKTEKAGAIKDFYTEINGVKTLYQHVSLLF